MAFRQLVYCEPAASLVSGGAVIVVLASLGEPALGALLFALLVG